MSADGTAPEMLPTYIKEATIPSVLLEGSPMSVACRWSLGISVLSLRKQWTARRQRRTFEPFWITLKTARHALVVAVRYLHEEDEQDPKVELQKTGIARPLRMRIILQSRHGEGYFDHGKGELEGGWCE